MRKCSLLFASACLIVFGAAPLCARAQSQPQPQPDTVETFLRSQMQKRHIPGLQVAVVQHGKIVLLGAYGLASVQESVPVTNQTVFAICSITKAFTGVAIMQLVEAGKLDLAAPVSRYFDGLPADWQSVTIQRLLTNSSGIPNIMNNNTANLVAEGDDAAWAKVQTMPMEFAAGERFSYSQTNYLLLGRIIDKLSGEPFTQFFTERQLHVVEMPLTVFGDSHDVVPRGTREYTFMRPVDGGVRRTDKLGNLFYEYSPFLLTAAGLNSTAEEMGRWIIALEQGQLLREKTSLETLWTPGRLNNGSPSGFSKLLNGYALGWPTVIRTEHRAVAPIGGGRSALFVYPDDDLAVVVLTNLQGANPEEFIDEIAGYYIPEMRASAGWGLAPSVKRLRTELMKRGFDRAPEVASELKNKDAKFQLAENDLNVWGYRLIQEGQLKDAIEVFRLNVSLYPQSGNTYDSLAEAYANAGDKTSAIKNYTRSLELDPKNDNAAAQLKRLGPVGAGNGAK